MSDKVLIFGKAGWPYTSDAREAFANRGYDIEYHDVKVDGSALQTMLGYSGGKREVPVIVEGGQATIGFGGSW